MSDAQWSRIDNECTYEAEKATASAGPRTPIADTWRRLYVMCAELKGAKFVGRVTMPNEKWRTISMQCKEEAKAAITKYPASRIRDELKEDLELECLERQDAEFRKSY
ncbi:hypothetical protein [Microvirga terricola]|uniref:Uncharacterized protein n=1 Tax=Microvirga terricola TaxID=2719797 RepID=A0ABX0VBY7_9HYPH|nr:hypothetical protein [Microvirga terricola]NIX76901.1 hypothetical protein [Microvirga terricola]